MGAQHLGAGDHLHAVLGLAEHPGAGLAEQVLVDHHMAQVEDDVIGALALDDALQDDPLDTVGKFPLDIAGQGQVVLRHEFQGVGVHEGKDLGGEFVDAGRGAVFEDGLGDLFFSLVQGSGTLRGDLVGVAVADGQAFEDGRLDALGKIGGHHADPQWLIKRQA